MNDSDRLVHIALALDEVSQRSVAKRLESAGFALRFVSTAGELAAVLPECRFLLVGRPPRLDWTPAVQLRLLQIAGTGVDPLFPATGLAGRTWIANCRGFQADAVRDHALALLLALARDLPGYLRSQSRSAWSPFPSPSLRGKKLVVVGFGDIGTRVAEAARGFGLRVHAVRRRREIPTGVERVAGLAELEDVLGGADFAVICLPCTRLTRGAVGGTALAALPPRAVLVDVSRGGVVDHAAVERALREGRLAGAALDVFEDEPLASGSTLWSCPGLVVTPHVGGFTPDYIERVLDVFVDNLALVQRGLPPSTLVSREHEY
jgi:phosphoglycerate dehydrogenase-like enzyme